MGPRVGQWLREPLLHFLVAGTALFALWSGPGDQVAGKDDRIVVTAAMIEQLAETWTRLHLRPPTAQELDGLIQDHVREEVMYREAMSLGLDRDDTIIRRRLRQKLEFVSEDLGAPAGPSERQLHEYLAQHADAFRVEPRVSFRHVFLSPTRRGAGLGSDVERLLGELNRPDGVKDTEERGDPFLLPFDFDGSKAAELARLFGDTFAAALGNLDPGVWHGPIQSGYGAHLVYVRERIPGRVPPLSEVRAAVQREWEANARREANEAFYRHLRGRYTVSIEQPRLATTLGAPEGR